MEPSLLIRLAWFEVWRGKSACTRGSKATCPSFARCYQACVIRRCSRQLSHLDYLPWVPQQASLWSKVASAVTQQDVASLPPSPPIPDSHAKARQSHAECSCCPHQSRFQKDHQWNLQRMERDPMVVPSMRSFNYPNVSASSLPSSCFMVNYPDHLTQHQRRHRCAKIHHSKCSKCLLHHHSRQPKSVHCHSQCWLNYTQIGHKRLADPSFAFSGCLLKFELLAPTFKFER